MTQQWTSQKGAAPQQSTRTDEINLGLGQPSPRLLPRPELAKSAASRLGADGDPLVLQYGTAMGTQPMRSDLAAFLSRRHGTQIGAEQLMVSPGNSGALGLLCTLLRGQATHAIVEDPTYFHAASILRSHGLEPAAVPIDEHGLRVDQLAERLDRNNERPAFVYCMPAYHNPTGITMSAARRRQLLKLAARHDIPIIADEPYNLLHFGPTAPLPLASEPGSEQVISLGSFSKILAPGLRLGWFHTTPRRLSQIVEHGVLRSGGALNPIIASIVHDTIESGFLEANIDALRSTLGTRARAFHDALRARAPDISARPADGGYFLWLRLPDGIDAIELLRAAQAHGLRFVAGPTCSVPANHAQHLRVSFAFYEAPELVHAATRLVAALASVGDAAR